MNSYKDKDKAIVGSNKVRQKKSKAAQNQNNLGAALMRSRFSKSKNLRLNPDGSIKHTTEIEEGPSWSKTMQSVTAESDLDAFLSTAQLAGTEFTAERLTAIQVITKSDSIHTNQFLLSPEKEVQVLLKHEEFKSQLTVPRRPKWTSSTTPEQLIQLERDSFLTWRRNLAKLEETQNLLLTPYERNLEIWRQLWRVLERSQLIVQIVDSRNPLLFRNPDLEKYISEIDPAKKCVVLLNKADMLTTKQRKQWGRWLNEQGVKFFYFSAKRENIRIEKELEEEKIVEKEKESEEVDESEEEEVVETRKVFKYQFGDEDEAVVADEDSVEEPIEMEGEQKGEETDIESESETEVVEENSPEAVVESEHEEGDEESEIEDEEDDEFSRVVSVDELVQLLQSECPEPKSEQDNGKSTIGFVGYPNVGKSSTLNAIIGSKKVAVAATPGKTKHFQTIHLDASTILCDCPGLVFPSFATTKADMVCNGILPIDQLREHTGPSALVAQRIPKELIEAIYGIKIVMRDLEGLEVSNRSPSSEELLQSYAVARGYTKAGQGNPDEARAARYILKDYVNGKLVYVHPPPGHDAGEFNEDLHARQLEKWSRVRRNTAVSHVNVESRIDNDFFDDSNVGHVNAGTKGKFATGGFVRKVGGNEAVIGRDGKPMKKKHHNKAEKRRGKVRTQWTKVE